MKRRKERNGYHRVLIDTWWNVNNLFIINYVVQGFVLIDTWWNVNFR